MDKISGLGMPLAQQEILGHLQQVAARVGAGVAGPLSNTGFAIGDGVRPVSFGQVLNQAIDSVDRLQHSASARQTAIDTGQSDDLTGTMIESQKASVAFSAMVQVRNKLSTGLDELINMAL